LTGREGLTGGEKRKKRIFSRKPGKRKRIQNEKKAGGGPGKKEKSNGNKIPDHRRYRGERKEKITRGSAAREERIHTGEATLDVKSFKLTMAGAVRN